MRPWMYAVSAVVSDRDAGPAYRVVERMTGAPDGQPCGTGRIDEDEVKVSVSVRWR